MGKGGGGHAAPAIEPVKPAQASMASAGDAAMRSAMMRRGIAGTFNRPTMQTGAAGATSGSASKLGG